jgi:hypothetical protein
LVSQLYNDPYRLVQGTKLPEAMGQPASECWPEIWDVVGPLVETPASERRRLGIITNRRTRFAEAIWSYLELFGRPRRGAATSDNRERQPQGQAAVLALLRTDYRLFQVGHAEGLGDDFNSQRVEHAL